MRRWLYAWVVVCRGDLIRSCCLVWKLGTSMCRGRRRQWLLRGYSIPLVPKVVVFLRAVDGGHTVRTDRGCGFLAKDDRLRRCG